MNQNAVNSSCTYICVTEQDREKEGERDSFVCRFFSCKHLFWTEVCSVFICLPWWSFTSMPIKEVGLSSSSFFLSFFPLFLDERAILMCYWIAVDVQYMKLLKSQHGCGVWGGFRGDKTQNSRVRCWDLTFFFILQLPLYLLLAMTLVFNLHQTLQENRCDHTYFNLKKKEGYCDSSMAAILESGIMCTKNKNNNTC